MKHKGTAIVPFLILFLNALKPLISGDEVRIGSEAVAADELLKKNVQLMYEAHYAELKFRARKLSR
ncbi:hypothetical protein L4D06_16075 [Enterovibrio makurazakiensis]|uniref:hypothetical protein n=1 Tax=Enterovibrio makurazakiensis TaxID=2910232 RepID=UPI003D19C779